MTTAGSACDRHSGLPGLGGGQGNRGFAESRRITGDNHFGLAGESRCDLHGVLKIASIVAKGDFEVGVTDGRNSTNRGHISNKKKGRLATLKFFHNVGDIGDGVPRHEADVAFDGILQNGFRTGNVRLSPEELH